LLLPKLSGLLGLPPPMPPWLWRDSRNRPATSSRGKARLPAAQHAASYAAPLFAPAQRNIPHDTHIKGALRRVLNAAPLHLRSHHLRSGRRRCDCHRHHQLLLLQHMHH
jgi:hypothetical protein